jgi:hypothetical protein
LSGNASKRRFSIALSSAPRQPESSVASMTQVLSCMLMVSQCCCSNVWTVAKLVS